MLFVPDHGKVHSDLLKAKRDLGYFNESPKRNAVYKESHLTEFKSQRDVDVAQAWLDLFMKHTCYFRAVLIDWAIWDGSHFGNPFEPDALKRRRAYKKWAEMLLHAELKEPATGGQIKDAELYLDRLRIMYGYDVLDHLQDRFQKPNYLGSKYWITKFQHTDSWRDANQCLQLSDLLTGSLYQALVPAKNTHKLATRDYLAELLEPQGVKDLGAKFWRGYDQKTLSKHFPKYSVWFWRPEPSKKDRKGFRAGCRRGQR